MAIQPKPVTKATSDKNKVIQVHKGYNDTGDKERPTPGRDVMTNRHGLTASHRDLIHCQVISIVETIRCHPYQQLGVS